jgi:hypothetical protein
MPSTKTELLTIKRLISQADLILEGAPLLPENRTAAAREALASALALTSDLLKQSKLPAAAVMGRKGGAVVAQRGSEYFRQLAAKRKTRAGGRPKKTDV